VQEQTVTQLQAAQAAAAAAQLHYRAELVALEEQADLEAVPVVAGVQPLTQELAELVG
jgi:hypothetical protein